MEVFPMELNFKKTKTCRLAAKGKWGNAAAVWMGLSFFLRMVYYFGLVNLNDVPGFEVAFCVVLPLAVSVVFILMLKLPRLAHPMAAAGLALAYAVNYFFAETMTFGGLFSGLFTLAAAGLILAAVLGYVPQRKWLIWAGLAALAVRLLLVDVFGYLLPLTELDLVAYIPKASNLFGTAAVAFLCAALRLKKAE